MPYQKPLIKTKLTFDLVPLIVAGNSVIHSSVQMPCPVELGFDGRFLILPLDVAEAFTICAMHVDNIIIAEEIPGRCFLAYSTFILLKSITVPISGTVSIEAKNVTISPCRFCGTLVTTRL